MDKETLILEISGEYGKLNQYQEQIAEASVLGIKNVFFSFVWDRDVKKGKEILNTLVESCKKIDVMPLSYGAGYCATILDGPMIGEMDQNGNLSVSYSWKEFSQYKESRGLIADSTKIHRVLEKIK